MRKFEGAEPWRQIYPRPGFLASGRSPPLKTVVATDGVRSATGAFRPMPMLAPQSGNVMPSDDASLRWKTGEDDTDIGIIRKSA